MKTRLTKIFAIAAQVMSFITTTIVTIVTMATAYIVFAPDVFPKPFYLLYQSTAPLGGVPNGYTLSNQASESAAHDVSEESSSHTTTKKQTELEPGEGIMIGMSTKIINLADPGGHKYIRLTVVLEFAPGNPDYRDLPEEEAAAYLTEFQNEVGNSMPSMDDVVITLLSTKTFEELYTAEGKEALRTEVRDAINERSKEFTILSVYFTEFVVQ